MFSNTAFEVILSAVTASFIAQAIKISVYTAKNRKINFKVFIQMGGMPSSVSAFAMALSTSVGLISGYSSTQFALTLGYALIIMYDAAGLKKSTGKMGTVLNKVVNEHYLVDDMTKPSFEIFTLIGHTPLEVLLGGLIGCIISLFCHLRLAL